MNDDDHASGPSRGQQYYQPGQPNPAAQQAAPQSAAPQQPQYQAQPPAGAEEQHFYNPGTPQVMSQAPYDSADPAALDVSMEDNGETVTWTASEFIAHSKSIDWYLAVAILTILAEVVAYYISHDYITMSIIVVVAILFTVGGSRQPRQMQYAVDNHGVSIGRHFYPYGNFRSFSVASEGPFRSIILMPLKRFMPTVTIYFDPVDENRIGDILADHLPMHEHIEATTDKLMRRIRF